MDLHSFWIMFFTKNFNFSLFHQKVNKKLQIPSKFLLVFKWMGVVGVGIGVRETQKSHYIEGKITISAANRVVRGFINFFGNLVVVFDGDMLRP